MVAARAGGRIVNIASTNGFVAEPDCASYNASKAAVFGLTQSMACDLAAFGITVNAIAPGWIRSPMSTPFLGNLGTQSQWPHLVGRVGEPGDVAGAVAWLVDPASEFVTGASIVVDGGQTAVQRIPERPGP
jgi:NAD(P)-dependent dehydrogenase (short-subunit alcohol dehydrogenase family)